MIEIMLLDGTVEWYNIGCIKSVKMQGGRSIITLTDDQQIRSLELAVNIVKRINDA